MIQAAEPRSTFAAGSTVRSSGEHHRKLERLQQLGGRRRLATLLFGAALVFALLAATLAAADFVWELPWLLRAAALASVVASIVGGFVALRRRLRFEAADAAAKAEATWPELGQRLRTSHDYALMPDRVAPADPRLIESLQDDTAERMRDRKVEPLAPAWPVWAVGGALACAAIAWLATLAAEPEWRTATARLALLPVEYTTVDVKPLPEKIGMGESLKVEATVVGRPLDDARVLYRPVDSDEAWSELPMDSFDGDLLIGEVRAEIADVRRDIEVLVEAGPREHPPQLVVVRIPLELVQWKAKVEPPAYTRLPASEADAESLQVPEGSAVTLTATYNRPPQTIEASLLPDNTGADLPLELQDTTARGTLIDLRKSLEVTLHARAADAMTNDSPPLPMRVIPDQLPLVRFTSPEEKAEAIPTAEVRFSIEASDDYGLSRVGIRYKIGNGPEQTMWEAAPADLPDQLRHTVTFPLEELELTFNEAISYYAIVEDNRQPEPQQAVSEMRFLDIRPFQREYEFRESNCNGQCQGECLSLEKLIDQQRVILQRTFTAQRRSVPSEAARLAEEEAELLGKTESLTAALESKVGPIPPLHRAIEAMQYATTALESAALPMGVFNEEEALAQLIQARQNLRKILKLSNSQSAACKQVDRQEQQKLRPPEREKKEQEKKEQQLARLRHEMQKLAQRQKSFCQSASQCSSSSSSSQSQAQSQAQSEPQTQAQPQSQQSQQAESKSPSQSQSSSQSPSPTSPSEMRQQLVEQQRANAAEAERIQRELESGEFGELAPQRMQEAGKAIAQSGQSLSKENDADAIEQAESAAAELGRLAGHLGQRHSPDFSAKLDDARKQAGQLAAAQRQLNQAMQSAGGKQPSGDSSQQSDGGKQPSGEGNQKSGDNKQQSGGGEKPASNSQSPSGGGADDDLQQQQRGLARRGEELADLVEQLQSEAGEQSWEIERQIAQQAAAHPPAEAARAMSDAAEKLGNGKSEPAARQGRRAAEDLEGLAAGLREVQQAVGQAELEKLIDAERRAAELLERMQAAKSAADQALARAKASELSDAVAPLSRGDRQLREANQQLKSATSPNSSASSRTPGSDRLGNSTPQSFVDDDRDPTTDPRPAEVGESGRRDVESLRRLDQVLQRRIQEAILHGSLQQADEAVPPPYKDMIESYYRALSEDIE